MANKSEIDEVGGAVPMDTSGVGCGAMILLVIGSAALLGGVVILMTYAVT